MQRWIIETITDKVAGTYHVEVDIEGVDLSLSKHLIFNGVLVLDDMRDTLLYVDRVTADVDSFKIKTNQLHLSYLELTKPYFNVLKDSGGYRFDTFTDTLQKTKTKKRPPIDFKCKSFKISQGMALYRDFDEQKKDETFSITNLFVDVADVAVKGSDELQGIVKKMSFKGDDDLELKTFAGDFYIKKKALKSKKLLVQTLSSAFGVADLEIDFKRFLESGDIGMLDLHAQVLPSVLSIRDLSFLNHAYSGELSQIGFDGLFSGSVSNLRGRKVSVEVNDVMRFKGDFSLDGLPDIEHTFIFVDLQDAYANLQTFRSSNWPDPIANIQTKFPTWLDNVGEISYNGNFTGFINDFVSYGELKSDVGTINADLSFKPIEDKNLKVNGSFSTESLDLSAITKNDELGDLNVSTVIDGIIDANKNFDLNINGSISSIEYHDYLFKNIQINGVAENKRYRGAFLIDDPNIFMDFEGVVDLMAEKPIFEFNADFKHVNLYELNFMNDSISELGFSVMSNFRARNIDEWYGRLTFDSIQMINSNDSVSVNRMEIISDMFGNDRLLTIESDLFDCTLKGKYKFSQIGRSMSNFIARYLPSSGWRQYANLKDENGFNLELEVKDLSPITRLFYPSINVKTPFLIDGNYYPLIARSDLTCDIPYIQSGNRGIENISIRAEADQSDLQLRMRFDKMRFAENINIYNFLLDSKGENDRLRTNLFWNNNGETTYSGNIKTVTTFRDNPNADNPHVNLNVKHSTIYVADTLWNIHATNILIDSTDIGVKHLKIESDRQSIDIDGMLSSHSDAPLNINFQNINMSILKPFLPPKTRIGGRLNGDAAIGNVYNAPQVDMKASIKPFYFNNKDIGIMEMESSWNNLSEQIETELVLERNDSVLIQAGGVINPQNGHFDLMANFDHSPVSLMDVLMPPALTSHQGEATGSLHFTGVGKRLNVDGTMHPEGEISLLVTPLNTRYYLDDPIHFSGDSIIFKAIEFRDKDYNDGFFDGSIKHTNFKDMVYDLNISTDRLMVMNTNLLQSPQFYGIGYVSGFATITGEGKNVLLEGTLLTEKGSDIVIPLDSEVKAKEYDFIKFVDHAYVEEEKVEYNVETSGMQMNLNFRLTPDARAQIVFNSQLGDVITATGNGNLQVAVDRNFKVDIFGNYEIEEGDYSFTFQNVVNKKFNIQKGSELKWTGAPYNADIRLSAIYNLKASLYNLFLDSYALSDTDFSRRMPVQCIIMLEGQLMQPDISFDINLPTAEDRISDELEQFISTEEDMTRQVTFLLLAGQFYTPEYLRGSQVITTGADLVGTTASELLSNYLSSWLSKISDDFDIGINYRPGNDVTTEQLELALSTQMFNDRVFFNGNIGNSTTPTGGQNYDIVGDFDLIVKLNSSGKLQAKVYNRSNDKLIYDTAPYTQGIGIKYQEDFNSLSDLWERLKDAVFRKKRIKVPPPVDNSIE